MRWNGIIDFTDTAPCTQTNTAGNLRTVILHKGAAFPTGTSIPQSGQLFFYSGSSTYSTPPNQVFYYTGSSWATMGGNGGILTGTEVPDTFPTGVPVPTLWYALDTSKLYCYTGISGYSGSNAKGWFNLMNATYAP